ncbi:MAG: hypothetical protein K2O67_00605, partial [Clostridia bacterium]|nr:hypothetical protein [Clostridia bacterium]
VPRIDLNATAHKVIDLCGGLEGVLKADAEKLSKADGIGIGTAEYLVCLSKVLERCGRSGSFAVINTTEKFKEFLRLRPVCTEPALEVFMLDRDARVRRIYKCYPEKCKGGVFKDRLFKAFSASKPYGIYAVYRRVGGSVDLRAEDDAICADIKEVARICGVQTFDFCIEACGDIFSYNVEERGVFGYGK